MNVMSRGVVAQGEAGSDRQSLAFAQICVLPSGRWISSMRAAPMKAPLAGQCVLVTWSDDQGKTWNDPISPMVPVEVNGKIGTFRQMGMLPVGGQELLGTVLWVDQSKPGLEYFNTETEGLLDTRIFSTRSFDGGQTWISPTLIDMPSYDMPTPPTGAPLRLANGDIVCQLELNKHYNDPKPWMHWPVFWFSSDDGKTWTEDAVPVRDPDNRILYWDQRPVVLKSGKILDMFWTFDSKTGQYLNIHACESADNGRTWSDVWDTGVSQQPAPPVELADGTLAMAYVDRAGAPAIRLRTSSDGGRSWPADTEVTIYELAGDSQSVGATGATEAWDEMEHFSVGLPCAVLTLDGRVLVTYYAGESTDHTQIEWAVVG